MPRFRRYARALAIGVAGVALIPASASASPIRDAPAAPGPRAQSTAGDLDWGAVTLTGTTAIIIVTGALGIAAAGNRGYLPTVR